MNFFKKLALAATLGVVCLGSAQAAEEDTTFLLTNIFDGVPGTTEQYYTVSNLDLVISSPIQPRLAGDTFVDDYLLEVLDSQTFSLFINAQPADVTFSSVTMLDNAGDTYPFITSSFNAVSFLGTGLTLDSGLYTLEVTGTINADGGAYSGALSNIAPVPEPEQWAMLLVGLSAVGFFSRRRTNRGR